jgi:hypothetical protein
MVCKLYFNQTLKTFIKQWKKTLEKTIKLHREERKRRIKRGVCYIYRLKDIKISILPQLIYTFNKHPMKFLILFIETDQLILKLKEVWRASRDNAIIKKTRDEGLRQLVHRTNYKRTVTKRVCYKDRQVVSIIKQRVYKYVDFLLMLKG